MDSIERMSLEDQIALCSGADNWHTKAMPDVGVPILCMSDGPHGLRKMPEGAGEMNINNSLPATCFPTAVLSACSWDPKLLEEVGRAIGEEAASYGVGLLLGPGANIKRNPLCGRNFEYFSEDPVLTGKLAAAMIRGVESSGVGACLKHFACNSQEYKRFNSDSVLDERTLREIYLSGFETAVKEGRPSAVMCAYNKVNGEHCSDSKKLLTDILREEWGFDGMVVTDWGAMNDRIRAFEAGCDLNMPGGSAYQEREAAAAVRDGKLDPACVARSAERVAKLALRAQAVQKEKRPFDAPAHHALAKRIALESAVLLKNKDSILPLSEDLDLLFVGPMATQLRYQGGGSSHINPLRLRQLSEICPDIPVLPGCLPDGSGDKKLLQAAEKAAKKAGAVVVFAGLPDSIESEGFDRDDMKLPAGYNELIERVAAVNPRTVVVLCCGSPVELPWADKVKGILYLGLSGEAGAEAAVDLLFGKANPSGKLAESWPMRYRDCVSSGYYAGQHKDAHYREGLYVGYRWYQKAGIPLRYSFGYGLSYTSFSYSDLEISGDTVSCRVKNTGKLDGAETVQFYISPPDGSGYRPVLELKRFEKLFLKRGESKTVSFTLDDRCFAVWQDAWIVPKGEYGVHIGSSSEQLLLHGSVRKDGVSWDGAAYPDWYCNPVGAPSHIAFEHLLGRPAAEQRTRKGSYTMDNTLDEMREDSLAAKLLSKGLEASLAKLSGAEPGSPEYRMTLSSTLDAPLRTLKIFMAKDSAALDAVLELSNGHAIRALRKVLEKPRQ